MRTAMLPMIELKPCPFCGRVPIVDDCGENRFFVRCKCGIAQDKLYGQRCDAVRRWNTRRPEPKKGRWYDVGSLSCRCSECGCKSPKEYSFCPNCGADMRGEDGEEK